MKLLTGLDSCCSNPLLLQPGNQAWHVHVGTLLLLLAVDMMHSLSAVLATHWQRPLTQLTATGCRVLHIWLLLLLHQQH